MTNHNLREAYDKHNHFYSEEDFTKKKMKHIPLFEKYFAVGKGVSSLMPYLIIIHMALSETQSIGRRLAICKLFIFMFIVIELKKPNKDPGVENKAVLLMHKHLSNPLVGMWFHGQQEFMTVHQVVNYLVKGVWQPVFQLCMSISRLLDINID